MNWLVLIAVLKLILGTVLLWLGTVIFRENPQNRINRITALMLVFAALGPIFAAIGVTLQPATAGQYTQAPTGFPYNLVYLWELFFPQLLLFSLVFPREHRWVSQYPRAKYLIFAPHVFHVLWITFFARPGLADLAIAADSSVARLVLMPLNLILRIISSLLALLFEFQLKFFSLVNLVYIAAAIGALRWGYRDVTNPRLRNQVRILIWGISTAVALYAVAFIGPSLGLFRLAYPVHVALFMLALVIGSTAIAWSIIRYQFLDIRLIVRQSLVFTISSGALVGLYLLLVTRVAGMVKSLLEIQTPLIDIAFVILVLIFFQPIKDRVDDLVTRLFLRDRADPRAILESFSRQIASVFDINDLKRRVLDVLTDQMFVERAFFTMRATDGRFVLELAGAEREPMPPDDWFFTEIQRRGRPTAFEEFVIDRPLTPMTEILTRWGCRLAVPIIERETLTGALLLGDKASGYKFGAEDVHLLSTLANQLAVALTSAGLYRDALERQKLEEEMQVARKIQMRLLPRELPRAPSIQLAAFSQPSRQVGGDYYDAFFLPDGRLALIIADVSGKGLGAALLVSQLQAILRSDVRNPRPISEYVVNANIQITETTSPEQFATLVFAALDLETGHLSYTNAGHNYPIVVRGDGSHELLDTGGLVLGIMHTAGFEVGSVPLRCNDVVVLYTDGLTDLVNAHGDDFGEGRVVQIIRDHRHLPAQALMDEIVGQASLFASGSLDFDDLTVLVLKMGE